MEHLVTQSERFHWLDVVDPTEAELRTIAEKYGLHSTSVQDCLDPEHLPKYERFGNLTFVILRAYDDVCFDEADTVQELTRKVAVFYTDTFLLTVHRKDQPFFSQLREKWKTKVGSPADRATVSDLLSDLLRAVVGSYGNPIDNQLNELERLEMGVFGAQGSKPFHIKNGYFLKRKSSVFKRMLRATIDLLPKITQTFETHSPHFQDLKEEADSLYFYADELMESANSLLNLHISLSSQKTNEASHRTNEVVRVLTIFSVFLLPLNLITGIYGMNFEHMPELRSHYGYPLVLVSMFVVALSVYVWFRRRGWLK